MKYGKIRRISAKVQVSKEVRLFGKHEFLRLQKMNLSIPVRLFQL